MNAATDATPTTTQKIDALQNPRERTPEETIDAIQALASTAIDGTVDAGWNPRDCTIVMSRCALAALITAIRAHDIAQCG